ncbi:threonine/serine exporter family protein [Aliivibrio sp. S4TY2]|uniref:threonine/serine exporter family protein n=1 Tax=unclassified Aliivibrio TaxID=2645654 RepID=UPI0023791682|nr:MULTISPECIES: threonine/serine exporter family protein [unclassified Aliivibrio]MDD9157552.1 threonine/serine exporter family protein [Aliivibrio sp. S4TY2]MDD9161485.1 threonine/serine exporter family protein [Aliivibrio sp. S4TY1]MDD9165462.1 threonine/serine exporter family protein [Aliivibrio sp. S4MY2]MDD9169514.1 threonine/serine exporter family protein [Aliivibrio sp. S4MY4]MDD9186507.1 threonine/serine exporter family protein [Aliivibrio sp. S4MY3]
MPSQYRINRIVEIGDTLHRCGCAPYKVERYTTFYANKYGVNCMIQATPTSINYQFPDDNNAVIMKRHKPASIDLGLLANTIIQLQQPLTPVPLAPAEGISYPSWAVCLANMCIPPAFLMLVGSTYEALCVSFLLGFLVWLSQVFCSKRRSIAVEFFGALIVAFSVAFIASLGVPIPILGLCIAAVVLFVPGLSISNALECLAFNDLVSGTSLLGQCFLTLIKLLIGIIIGLHIGEAIFGTAESIDYQNEFPIWLQILGLPIISFSLGVMFKARPIDTVYSLPVAVLGMWGPFYLGFDGGWVVGTWVTTVLITLYGTWIARQLNLTGIIFIVQGIIILVPGSRVLVSASQSVFEQSILPIPSIGLSALFMFSAIVAGQITAYSIYSPKIERDL